ncbi:hypothetical protein [Ornithinimicrobium pratense]|uniref:hypothetical protein n=1 Tax=Ornithinimicrobium pratense TaxID=2593973 RepID=UPI001EE28219|nr:hypothetical protein [Ornithinimicrobium pratense]
MRDEVWHEVDARHVGADGAQEARQVTGTAPNVQDGTLEMSQLSPYEQQVLRMNVLHRSQPVDVQLRE